MKHMTGRRIIGLVLAVILTFVSPLCNMDVKAAETAKELSPEEIYEMCEKAVVVIRTYDAYGQEYVGTGFFTTKTQILTNYHVLDSAVKVKITGLDGREYSVMRINRMDSKSDMILLKMNETNTDYLRYATGIKRGEKVYCVGNPLGLTGHFTEGLVSRIDKDIDGNTYIQTSLPCGQGMGGAPVLNKEGKVIGMSTIYISSAECISFALRYDVCKTFVDSITKDMRRDFSDFLLENSGISFKSSNVIDIAKKDKKVPYRSAYYTKLETVTGEKIYEKARKCTVDIVVEDKKGIGSGSGFFINDDYIVTNRHVVEGVGAANILCTDYDGFFFVVDQVIYNSEGADAAILKVDRYEKGDIKEGTKLYEKLMECEDMTKLEGTSGAGPLKHEYLTVALDYVPNIGEKVYACGSPAGYSQTFSDGTVSMCFREVDGYDYINSTIPITAGSSGGPMFNQYGEVIGIMALSILIMDRCNFAVAAKYIDAEKCGNLVCVKEDDLKETMDEASQNEAALEELSAGQTEGEQQENVTPEEATGEGQPAEPLELPEDTQLGDAA